MHILISNSRSHSHPTILMFDCESFKVEIEDAQGSNHFLYQSKNTFVLSNAAKGKEC